MFCAMLGTVAGNLVLTLGAQGGVYIAGGIVPRLGQRFAESGFRERFEAKGRMQPVSRGGAGLCRDPQAAGFSRLRRGAGGVALDPAEARARRGGAAQPVVDRAAEPLFGDRHHRDAGKLRPVEPAQHREQVGRRLGEVAAFAKETAPRRSPAAPSGPNASRASPGRALVASSRTGRLGA